MGQQVSAIYPAALCPLLDLVFFVFWLFLLQK
jgi:hypothetical protein